MNCGSPQTVRVVGSCLQNDTQSPQYPRGDRFSEELFLKSIFGSALYFVQAVVYFIQPTDRTTRAQFEITFK